MPAPKQPTINVRQPPNEDTKTIETNDPVTNEAEKRIAEEEITAKEEEQSQADIKAQEEQAKADQERADKLREFTQQIAKSPEGFVKRDESNAEGSSTALAEGMVYVNTVQTGPGGLEVEERVYLSERGYTRLREMFGPSMGV